MPVFQNTQGLQDQDHQCGESRSEVTDHHHELAIMTIHHDSGNGRDQQKRSDEENLHGSHRQRAPGLVIHPDT